MYKTIRHGENSLQYTILPQHDDYKGTDGKQRSVKTGHKKKSVVACIGLFFVCSIIVGAILVPLMISIEFMSSPSAWFYKSHKSNASGTHIKPMKTNRAHDIFKVDIDSNEILSFNRKSKQQQVLPTKYSTTVTYLPESTELDLITIIQGPTNSFSRLTQTTSSTTSPMKTLKVASTEAITTTSTTTTTTTTTEQQLLQKASTATAISFKTAYISKPTKLQSASPSSIIIEKLTKSFAKPIISIQPEFLNTKLPPVAADDVEKHKTSRNWIKSHWPIVDPSTYFSWTTYESEDNLLLPAIFCSALVAVVVFVLLCVVIRKRNCSSCAKKRHDFMAVEAENGDSAVLLTNDCPSDDE